MPANEHLQQHLFDPASTRGRTPGEVPFHQWLQRPDVAYHGTYNPSWESAPYAHFGDEKAATERLGYVTNTMRFGGEHYRQAYYSGETAPDDAYDDGDYSEEEQTHTGRVYARRLDLANQSRKLSDPIANAAQMHAMLQEGYEPWEVPGSVSESTEGRVVHDFAEGPGAKVQGPNSGYGTEREKRQIKAGSRLLQMGKGLTYKNVGERGETEVSHVVPRGGHTSWEEDVISDPNAPSTTRSFAKQRLEHGTASAVPFSEETARRVETSREVRPESEQMTFGSLGKAGVEGLGRKGYGDRSYAPWRHLSEVQFTSNVDASGEEVASPTRVRPIPKAKDD